ncbi:ubiquitin carboxyl-terminal hydrolase CYLD [Amia ocellicauda]|uniref:ubiquitin carboxyl-terminal hydrolase CYLD n=1 Tax=Amia ocellicauda TaxID=2972642 RepID=UPI003463A9C1
MSNAPDRGSRQRPRKMYLVESNYKVNDTLEGAMRVARGSLCQAQEAVVDCRPPLTGGGKRGRGEQLWVKVLDSDSVLKIDREVLREVPSDLACLLQPVSDLEVRYTLSLKTKKLFQLAKMELGAALYVMLSQSVNWAEGILRYRGPLTGGSSGVYFGVQLQGWAMGKGVSNGSYKGHQLFHCPDACAVFLPINCIAVVTERGAGPGPEGAEIVSRTTDVPLPPAPAPVPVPAPPHLLSLRQRIYFHMDSSVQRGEVQFCDVLPAKAQQGVFVGILLDNPVGSWDGYFKGQRLCSFPAPEYGILLPLSKVYPARSPVADQRPARTPQQPPSHPDAASLDERTQAPLSPKKPVQSRRSGSTGDQPPPPSQPDPPSPTRPHPRRHGTRPEEAEGEGQREAEGAESEPPLEVGSMVEVNEPPLYGVIRWLGEIRGIADRVAGLELDEELAAGTDGSYLGQRYFYCPPNKGLFVKLRNCRRDSRFPAHQALANQVERCNSIAFADWVSERVEEHTPPLQGEEARERFSGWKKGIQGNCNSCYLDASLFCLFSFNTAVDSVLLRPPIPQAPPPALRAQDLLRSEIVNPLRRDGYVCATKIMALRKILEKAGQSSGFTSEEKDPEEFLNKLFQLLNVEPLLKIRSDSQEPQACFLYQLFPQHPAAVRVPSIQTLLEWSFVHADLKFHEAPSCLLLLTPRFGKDYKMFEAVLPSLTLDITDLLDDTLRQCTICQSVAVWECVQCYEDTDITPGHIKQYCNICSKQVHSHRKRGSHNPRRVGVPEAQWAKLGADPVALARQRLELFAVLCIETSHYVSFVKHGPGDADWLFFDSMADREGGQNGFNIPQVSPCPEVAPYLRLSAAQLSELVPGSLQGRPRRLLCDAYMCLYHSPELSLYK